MMWSIIMANAEPRPDTEATRSPIPWRARAIPIVALAALALATGCQDAAGIEAGPTQDVAPKATGRTAPAAGQALRPGGVAHQGFAPGVTLRETPDLLADLEGRVGPQTKARLTDARDGGRAFAQRLGIEGVPAQGLADVFTELALEVAQAEQDTSPGSEERAEAVGVAAQNAFDGVRSIVPATALAEAEREIARWTGGVPVTVTYPSTAAARAHVEAPLP